jgi:hypothetical protein
MQYSACLHADPGPGSLVVLLHEPLEYENNNTSKLPALLDRAPDACAENEVGPPRPSPRRYACILVKRHIPRVQCGRLTRAELHESSTPAQATGRHAQHLDPLVPMRTTRNVRSSCTPLYKISACPPLCKPVPTTSAS